MIYLFECANQHKQEIQLNSKEFDELPRDEGKKFVACNIRYADMEYPNCQNKSFQSFGNVTFIGLETARS